MANACISTGPKHKAAYLGTIVTLDPCAPTTLMTSCPIPQAELLGTGRILTSLNIAFWRGSAPNRLQFHQAGMH